MALAGSGAALTHPLLQLRVMDLRPTPCSLWGSVRESTNKIRANKVTCQAGTAAT